MTLTEFIISLAISIGLNIALLAFIFVRLGQGRRFSGWDMLAYMCIPCTLFVGLMVLTLDSNDPGLYTRTLGKPQVAQIQGLTFMTGFLGRTNRVRVDTNAGVYVLNSDARIPRSGAVYIIQRKKPWGDARTFLCPDPRQAQCWAERDSGG